MGTKDALRKHISHNHKPEMPCSTCGKLIQRSRVALHNKLAHTSMEDRKYQCPSCPKGFNFKRRLEDHINTHTGKKPWICTICEHAAADYNNHLAHIRKKHGKEKETENLEKETENLENETDN